MITDSSGGYMTIGIVKHIPPPNCQFPTLTPSPIAPHLTPTEETSISLSIRFYRFSLQGVVHIEQCKVGQHLLGILSEQKEM